MQNKTVCGLNGILPYLPTRLTKTLQKLPSDFLLSITELRLRAEQPLMLVTPQQNVFITESGHKTELWRSGLLSASALEIEEIVLKACGYSAHSHQTDFANGCLTLPGGHRIGLCGTAVLGGDAVTGVRDVTALNIRIAKSFPNAAQAILAQCFQNRLQNVLLFGPPSSGKTTVLRALAQSLSSGKSNRIYKCAVIDERQELFPKNLGDCFADVLSGYPKADGIQLAVRVLSPDMVFCDEIGSAQDVISIADGIRCGVHFAVTAHAANVEELLHRAYFKSLFQTGSIDTVILLGTGINVGKVQGFYKVGENNAESDGASADFGVLRPYRDVSVRASA